MKAYITSSGGREIPKGLSYDEAAEEEGVFTLKPNPSPEDPRYVFFKHRSNKTEPVCLFVFKEEGLIEPCRGPRDFTFYRDSVKLTVTF